MKIHTGLFQSIVLPRNEKNVSAQLVTGSCRGQGTVSACVFKEGQKRPLLKLADCGVAHKGRFTAHVDGIPVGGPYTIELSVGAETLAVGDVLVGDVWILGGQSNMEGSGFITGKRLNTNPLIHAYYMDDKWAMAQDPIGRVQLSHHKAHLQLLNPPVPSRRRKNPDNRGAGLGIPFAQERYRQTGVPQGLLACAHGGTSIVQWDPATRNQGYDSLYGAMIQRVIRNGGRVTGMLWYQGGSDATEERCVAFEEKALAFFRSVRKDLKQPALPIVQGQIGRYVIPRSEPGNPWMIIRETQRRMPRKMAHLLTVSSMDMEYDDTIHFNEASYFVMGRRMAEAMQTLLQEKAALPPPIEFDRAVLHCNRRRGFNDVYVYFKNVAGGLNSEGRPNGFVFGISGEKQDFRAELMGACVVLHCTEADNTVAYGYGMNPYCNITDEAGRSLPAFMQQPIQQPFYRSEFSKQMLLSQPIPGNQDLKKVTYQQSKGIVYAPAKNEGPYNCFPDRADYLTENGIRFFRTKYQAGSDIDFQLALGYDGNVKVFVDGKAVYIDEKAKNPIIPAAYTIKQHWKKGKHEVVIAQAMNHGCTWGISLALETTPAQREMIPLEIVDQE